MEACCYAGATEMSSAANHYPALVPADFYGLKKYFFMS